MGSKCQFLVCGSNWKQGFEMDQPQQRHKGILCSSVAFSGTPRTSYGLGDMVAVQDKSVGFPGVTKPRKVHESHWLTASSRGDRQPTLYHLRERRGCYADVPSPTTERPLVESNRTSVELASRRIANALRAPARVSSHRSAASSTTTS